jgi:hypothetical protein
VKVEGEGKRGFRGYNQFYFSFLEEEGDGLQLGINLPGAFTPFPFEILGNIGGDGEEFDRRQGLEGTHREEKESQKGEKTGNFTPSMGKG